MLITKGIYMKRIIFTVSFVLLVSSVSFAKRHSRDDNWGIGVVNPQTEQVDGYIKKDGTLVDPYVRTKANSTLDDNYSTKGNENPYTGQKGYGKTDEETNNNGIGYKHF